MSKSPWGSPGSVGYHGPRCSKCGRMIESQWEYCAWCGASKEEQEKFEKRSKAIKEGQRKRRFRLLKEERRKAKSSNYGASMEGE